jgi:hypothetical protein
MSASDEPVTHDWSVEVSGHGTDNYPESRNAGRSVPRIVRSSAMSFAETARVRAMPEMLHAFGFRRARDGRSSDACAMRSRGGGRRRCTVGWLFNHAAGARAHRQAVLTFAIEPESNLRSRGPPKYSVALSLRTARARRRQSHHGILHTFGFDGAAGGELPSGAILPCHFGK